MGQEALIFVMKNICFHFAKYISNSSPKIEYLHLFFSPLHFKQP